MLWLFLLCHRLRGFIVHRFTMLSRGRGLVAHHY
jgi:hypothetical protein